MNSPALAASVAPRPTLFAAPGRALSDPSDAQRLLTSLLPAAPARRWPAVPRWAVAGAIALLAGAAVAVWAVSSGRSVAGGEPEHAVPLAAAHPVVTSASAAQRVSPVAPSAEPAALPQGARIEVESPAPVIAAASAPVRDPFQALSSTTPAAQPAASAQPVHAAISATPAKTQAAQPAAVAPAPVGAAPAKAAGDSDVDLIEAVMARVTGASAAGAGAVSKAAAKPAASDKSAPKVKPGKPAKATKPVAAEAHEAGHAGSVSLAEQVQQCRAAGWLDGLLCRNRVCEGHWGADAACPVNQPLRRDL